MNSSASAPSGSYPSASQLHGCPTAAMETPRPYSVSHGAYNTAVAAYNMTSPYSAVGLPHVAFGSNNFMVPLSHTMFSSYNGKFLDKLLVLLLLFLSCSAYFCLAITGRPHFLSLLRSILPSFLFPPRNRDTALLLLACYCVGTLTFSGSISFFSRGKR